MNQIEASYRAALFPYTQLIIQKNITKKKTIIFYAINYTGTLYMYIILIIIILFKEQQKQCLRIQKYLLKINIQHI